ncbi:MAG: sigma 54-interacting transcriptional regulator [Saccharofermentanales bacterium]
MTRISYIIPYLSDQAQINRILAGMAIPEDVQFELYEATEIQLDATRDWNSDIMIARGMTYDALRRHAHDIQLIEIAVTGYDIIKAVQKTIDTKHVKRLAIVLTHNTFVDVNFIERAFRIKIDFFKISNEKEGQEAVQRIKAGGCHDAVVAGGTVTRFANDAGVEAYVIESGDEAIKNAINEALAAIYASRAEKRRNVLINTMIESIGEGIIAVDQNQQVLFMNKISRRMLDIGSINIQGRNLEDFLGKGILPAQGSASPGESTGSASRFGGDTVIRKLGNRMVVVRALPISVEGVKEGAVLILQSVDHLQKAEIAVRQKLSQKGLVAKYNFEHIVGESKPMRKAVEAAKRYARTEHDVLITGETGTGKELFAQSIHNYSSRREQPFVALNCATISENLIESELFGYVEGSFTGALKGGKIGLFELAHRGTLFLDEISELPLAQQAKLLRVLEEKEIRKLGDEKIIPIDVRIIAATNVSLPQLAAAGLFREDLLYRLDILSLTLPPLRQRQEDIADLVLLFSEINNRENGRLEAITFEQSAIEELAQHAWKGNVRELRNICDRLFVLSSSNVISRQDVLDTLNVNLEKQQLQQEKQPETQSKLHSLLKDRDLTREELARELGISRTTLWRRLKNRQ